jgi:hypothetical protein
MSKAYSGRLNERPGDRGRPVTKIDSDTNNTRKSKAAMSSVLRCGREKRSPKGRQINSEISSMVEKYDMNRKLSFPGGCPGIPRATHSIPSPGGYDMKT